MLIRALFGGAISLGLMSIAQAAWQLVVLRLLQGATGGTSSAAIALVAADTPRPHVARHWAHSARQRRLPVRLPPHSAG